MTKAEDEHGSPAAARLLAHGEADDLPTGLDLAEIVDIIIEQLRGQPPDLLRGYLDGKTRLRDVVSSGLRCSQAQAELLIDTCEARGLVRYDPDDAPDGCWRVHRPEG